MIEAMPLQEVSLIPSPEILVEMAARGVDYTWPALLFGMAAFVMLIVSARRRVEAFSIALNYSNLWLVFGKRRRVRVRVHSFTSTTGVITASGEFSAELVKDDEEDEREFDDVSSRPMEKAGTEMVFIYGNSSSVFQTGSSTASNFSQRKFSSYFFSELLQTYPLCDQESMTPRVSFNGDATESRTKDEELRRVTEESEAEFFTGSRMGQGCEAFLVESPAESWDMPTARKIRRNAWPAAPNYPWDAEMNLRLAALNSIRAPFRAQELPSISSVVRGPFQTATLRKNVVKVWDNATRRAVMSLPLQNDAITSMDVDWVNKTALLGSCTDVLSLWDIERMTCVSSISSHVGLVNAMHYTHVSPNAVNDRWLLTTARSSVLGESSPVSLWDSRAGFGLAFSSANFTPRQQFNLEGFQLVVRDSFGRASKHDVRMLQKSPTTSMWNGDIEEPCSQRQSRVQNRKGVDCEDNSDSVFQEEEDYSEDAWVRVESECVDDSTSVSPPSPGLLSRCFSAISSVLAR